MNKITVTLLCLMLCLAGTGIPIASAASRLTTSSGTALTSCLQQEAHFDLADTAGDRIDCVRLRLQWAAHCRHQSGGSRCNVPLSPVLQGVRHV